MPPPRSISFSIRSAAAWTLSPPAVSSNLGVPAAVQARVDTLAELANEGLLTDDERAEYEAILNAEGLVAILKLKARKQLSDPM